MRVKEVMQRNVYTVSPTQTVREAGELLGRIHAGVLPVVDQAKRVLGIVTDRDLLLGLVARNAEPARLQVGEVMTRGAASCHPEDELMHALREMEELALRRLPVLDHDDLLVGLLCLDDVFTQARAYGEPELRGTLYPNVAATYQGILRRRARNWVEENWQAG